MQKVLVMAIVGTAFVGTPAIAADMPARMPVKAAPVEPIWNWAGFYVGGHFGYGWAFPEITEDTTGARVGNPPRPRGILGGAQLGYNWQAGRWVYGIEGDFTWSDVKGRSTCSTPAGLQTCQGLPDQYSTITGRVGYAADRMLYYVKGGGAWMGEKFKELDISTGVCAGTPCTGSNATWGWTIGAGAEYAIDPHWSARLEYDYLDFPKNEAVHTSNGTSSNFFHLTRTFSLIKLGLNYRFGGS
jgi:outer membrane immunogenic protein